MENLRGVDQAIRQELRELVAQNENTLRQEMAGLVTQMNTQTDQQFSQVGNRLGQLETTTGQQQNEIQKQEGRVGQLETGLTGLQATWQERATTAENEARQLRRDLDAQGHLQQALQKQLDEERKAREELARQVSKRLQPSQQKGKDHE